MALDSDSFSLSQATHLELYCESFTTLGFILKIATKFKLQLSIISNDSSLTTSILINNKGFIYISDDYQMLKRVQM